MNRKMRILVAIGALGASVAGLGFRQAGHDGPAPAVRPVPLSTYAAPIEPLSGPIESPYARFTAMAADQADAHARAELLERLEQLRNRWRLEENVAKAEPPPRSASTGRL